MAHIYLATSWRNLQQPAAVRALRDAGHTVYDFRNPEPGNTGFSWRKIAEAPPPWSAEETRRVLDHDEAARGFALDLRAMEECDVCVMLQPSGRSVALEIGWAVGAGKRTAVLLADEQEPELMLKCADRLCTSMEELLAWIEADTVTPGARVYSDDQRRAWRIRTFAPGAAAPLPFVLCGPQGTGKSAVLSILAGGQVDQVAVLRAPPSLPWIVEVFDPEAFGEKQMKAFVSADSDKARAPSARRATTTPRAFVVACTTNNFGWPRGRRVATVKVTKPADLALLTTWRDQLWAEAVHLYRRNGGAV